MDAAEIATHALGVSNGRTLITAQSLQQVKEAVLPELEKFIPPWFITRQTKTPLPKYTLTNGHEIIVYASNDEEKLRSLNLTAFWIVEASGVDYDIFIQLTARLRNAAAIVKNREGVEIEHNFMGIVESNPEDGKQNLPSINPFNSLKLLMSGQEWAKSNTLTLLALCDIIK